MSNTENDSCIIFVAHRRDESLKSPLQIISPHSQRANTPPPPPCFETTDKLPSLSLHPSRSGTPPHEEGVPAVAPVAPVAEGRQDQKLHTIRLLDEEEKKPPKKRDNEMSGSCKQVLRFLNLRFLNLGDIFTFSDVANHIGSSMTHTDLRDTLNILYGIGVLCRPQPDKFEWSVKWKGQYDKYTATEWQFIHTVDRYSPVSCGLVELTRLTISLFLNADRSEFDTKKQVKITESFKKRGGKELRRIITLLGLLGFIKREGKGLFKWSSHFHVRDDYPNHIVRWLGKVTKDESVMKRVADVAATVAPITTRREQYEFLKKLQNLVGKDTWEEALAISRLERAGESMAATTDDSQKRTSDLTTSDLQTTSDSDDQ